MNRGPPNTSEPTKQKTVSDNLYAATVSPEFGHIDDFWKRYDELADRIDREMVANLNTNLDVLLIFVGSFYTLLLLLEEFTLIDQPTGWFVFRGKHCIHLCRDDKSFTKPLG